MITDEVAPNVPGVRSDRLRLIAGTYDVFSLVIDPSESVVAYLMNLALDLFAAEATGERRNCMIPTASLTR